MKPLANVYKDRTVRSLAGALIFLMLLIQKSCSIDLSIPICCIAINLFQYGITGWCPFAQYFTKIKWLQNL